MNVLKKIPATLWAALIGFLLPWQTRYLIEVPAVGAVTWEFGVISVYLSQVVVAVWLIREWWPHRHTARITVPYTILAFILLQLAISAQKFLTLQLLVSAALLIGLGVVLRRRLEIRTPFFAAFIISSVLQAMLGFLQVVFGGAFASTILGIAVHQASDAGAAVVLAADGVRYLRAYGGQPHPNIFGFQMLVALVAFVSIVNKSALTLKRAHITQVSVVLAGALVLSFSRSALLAYLLVAALWWFGREKYGVMARRIMQRSFITVAVLLVVLAPLFFGRLMVKNPLEVRSVNERVASLTAWQNIFSEYRWGGVGWGAYSSVIDGATTGDRRVPVHNVFLLALAEFGIVGSALLLAGIGKYAKKMPPIFWCAIAPALLFDHFLLSLWAGMVLGAVLVFSLFEDN